jgi:hypothetical protein
VSRIAVLLLLISGCSEDVCAPYGGRACIALEVVSEGALSVDQLRLGSAGLALADEVTPRQPRNPPVALPVQVAIVPADPEVSLQADLRVDGLRLGEVVGSDVLSATLHHGEHLALTAHLLAERPDSFADLNGVDLGGADLTTVDLRAVDLAGADLAGTVPQLRPSQDGLFGGRVVAIDHDQGGTFYVATSGGGIFKGNGMSWTPINDGLPDLNIGHLAVDRTTSGTVYADSFPLSPPKIFRTNDGTHWTALNLPPAVFASIDALAVDPGDGKPLFEFSGDVYRADDKVSFAVINDQSPLPKTGSSADRPFQLLFTQPGHVLAVASSGVFRSIDEGVTWNAVNGGLPATRFLDPAGVDAVTGAVYVSSVQVFKSSNDGQSWSQLAGTGLPSLGAWGIAPANGVLFAWDGASGGMSGVQRSGDDGANFSDFSSGLTEKELSTVHISGVVLAGTHHSGVFTSNGSLSWSSASLNLTAVSVTALAQHPSLLQTIYAGTTGMGVFKSDDGGVGWVAHQAGLPVESITALGVDPNVPTRVYAGVSQFHGVFRSDDGGVNWSAASTGIGSTFEVRAFVFDPRDSNAVWAATSTGIFFSGNRGDSWSSRSTGLVHGTCCVDLEMVSLVMDPADSQTLWASSQGSGVWKTVNGGSSWTQTPLTVGVGGLAVDRQRTPRRLYAGTSAMLMRSDDGGTSWMTLSMPLSSGFGLPVLAVDPNDGGRLFVGDAVNAYFSGDTGGSFAVIDPATFPLGCSALLVDTGGHAFFGTRAGGGLFKSP